MPVKLTLILEGDKGKKHGSFLSSLLQGALMENIKPDYVQELHSQNLHPYSQYITWNKELIYYHISCLTEDAENYIIKPLLNEDFQEIFLKHRVETLRVVDRKVEEISYKELIDQYYFDQSDNIFKIRLITPTSFKQNGEYCIFPSCRLIFQNLMRRYDSCSPDNSIFSEDLLEHYEKYAKIVSYKLKTAYFHLEGVRIPAFVGEITIKIKGPQQMVNMAQMLMKFGSFSGVGIKTGIGMGGMEIVE